MQLIKQDHVEKSNNNSNNNIEPTNINPDFIGYDVKQHE
jgi:hypothetical protein